jgi:hypothetical protein
VIKALAERKAHVPYRNCQLTRLFTYALGGNNLFSFMAHVHPQKIQETLHTLQLSQATLRMPNHAELQVHHQPHTTASMEALQREIVLLRSQLQQFQMERPTEIDPQSHRWFSDSIAVHGIKDDDEISISTDTSMDLDRYVFDSKSIEIIEAIPLESQEEEATEEAVTHVGVMASPLLPPSRMHRRTPSQQQRDAIQRGLGSHGFMEVLGEEENHITVTLRTTGERLPDTMEENSITLSDTVVEDTVVEETVAAASVASAAELLPREVTEVVAPQLDTHALVNTVLDYERQQEHDLSVIRQLSLSLQEERQLRHNATTPIVPPIAETPLSSIMNPPPPTMIQQRSAEEEADGDSPWTVTKEAVWIMTIVLSALALIAIPILYRYHYHTNYPHPPPSGWYVTPLIVLLVIWSVWLATIL